VPGTTRGGAARRLCPAASRVLRLPL
jgi:hypothetical protein